MNSNWQWQAIQTCVLRQFPSVYPIRNVQPLGSAGGFSGAQFWRLEAPSGQLCLRAWPTELTNSDRLTWIHAVQQHLTDYGCRVIPELIVTDRQMSFVNWGQRFWELSRWMPGTADYWRGPSDRKLAAAMQTLANIHLTLATFPLVDRAILAPAGIRQRRQLIEETNNTVRARLLESYNRQQMPKLANVAGEILNLFPLAQRTVLQQIVDSERLAVPLQVVLRDVWHDHLLYSGESVTGVVDFGAMNVDSVALDIARLLGSLVGDDIAGWKYGLAAYQRLRRLSVDEQQLIATYDRSTVLLSGINWLRWLFLEQRQFDRAADVQTRLTRIRDRLRHLVDRLSTKSSE